MPWTLARPSTFSMPSPAHTRWVCVLVCAWYIVWQRRTDAERKPMAKLWYQTKSDVVAAHLLIFTFASFSQSKHHRRESATWTDCKQYSDRQHQNGAHNFSRLTIYTSRTLCFLMVGQIQRQKKKTHTRINWALTFLAWKWTTRASSTYNFQHAVFAEFRT